MSSLLSDILCYHNPSILLVKDASVFLTDPWWKDENEKKWMRKEFVEATLGGEKNREEVAWLLSLLKKKKISLSLEEEWIEKAFQNDCHFSLEKFAKLDEALKKQIHFVATTFKSQKVVRKLEPFFSHQTSLEQIYRPNKYERQGTRKEFVEALLRGSKEKRFATCLLSLVEKQKIKLFAKEKWFKKAFLDHSKFSVEKFSALDDQQKKEIYFVANAFGSEKVVKKLKPLFENQRRLFQPGRSLFVADMDVMTAKETVKNFLVNLRKEGSLLTEEEFNKLNPKKYLSKINEFGRIQGKRFIERIVQENHLKHIKVPQKIAVLKNSEEPISFSIDENDLELIPQKTLMVYAEKVVSVKRKMSLEEAIEMMIVLVKTGYNDIMNSNWFLCEDGIYFIDTEYPNFTPDRPKFNAIKQFAALLDAEDAKKFFIEFEKQVESFKKPQEDQLKLEQENESLLKDPYLKLLDGYRKEGFTFTLQELEGRL